MKSSGSLIDLTEEGDDISIELARPVNPPFCNTAIQRKMELKLGQQKV